MSSTYKEIADKNIEENGTKYYSRIKTLAVKQYSDKTHFIYELLQNAEDALCRRSRENPPENFDRKVIFRLFSDRLEFRHFGALFNKDDVKGITTILEGSKTEDSNQIGIFGIGFKSVYAFTNTPEIHSGDEHFIIEEYILPKFKKPDIKIKKNETVFIFPFNHDELGKEETFNIIFKKLKNLGSQVLLFLRNIEDIQWYNEENGENGEYIKETKFLNDYPNVRKVTLVGQNNGIDVEENWLIFDKSVCDNNENRLKVEVAYKLGYDSKNEKEYIKKINNPPLFVYFPTEKPIYTGFFINGPFKTTIARDNIEKEEPWNIELVDKVSKLVAESLEILKEQKLLSVSALEAMPINEDDFINEDNEIKEEIFYPLFEYIKEVLFNNDLLPTNEGSYIKGKNAKLARGDYLRDLFNDDMLTELYGSGEKLAWLDSKITADRTSELRKFLKECLDIEEIRPPDLYSQITSKFLTQQSDAWLEKFYLFLSNNPNIYRINEEHLLYQTKLIRLEDNTHVEVLDEDGNPSAFIPNNDYTTSFKLPIIKKCFTENEEIIEFFENIGLQEVDTVEEVIKNIIPIYHSDKYISIEEHECHIKQIKEAFELGSEDKKDRLTEKLCDTEFVLTKFPDNIFRKPELLYFETEELSNYFDNSSVFVDNKFYENIDFIDILHEIGVESDVRTFSNKPNYKNEIELEYDPRNRYRKGLQGFDPEFEVDGLQEAIENINLEKSEFIWRNIAIPYSKHIRGKVIRSSRSDFSNTGNIYEEYEVISDFGEILIDSEWLPGKDGNFYKPSDLFLSELPDSFIKDETLADKLEMKKDSAAKLAEEVGVELEDLDIMKQYPEEFNQWKNSIRNKSYNNEFPEKKSSNPERRQEKIINELEDAPDKEYQLKQRSVRNSRSQIDPTPMLIDNYTNDYGIMFCQICKEEMPFKKRNGDYYFEAVQIYDNIEKESESNYLALCPICAAMFKEFIKNDETAYDIFLNELEETESTVIPISLGDFDTDVEFVDVHFQDLKTILKHLKNNSH